MTIDVITENTTVQNATADNQYTGVIDGKLRQNNAYNVYTSDTTMEVNKWGGVGSDNTHSIIKFTGLSNVPSGATITSATLYLQVTSSAGSAANISLRRLLQSFNAAFLGWAQYDDGSTWNTGGATGAGTDRVATAESSTSIGVSSGTYYGMDCTSLVQDIVDGTIASDEGFHLERDSADAGNGHTFATSEGTDGTRPELVVEYTVSATPTVTDINTNETVLDAEANVTFTTTGFGSEISTATINDGTNSVACTGITSTGGAGDFDMPDATAVVASTTWSPFSSASHTPQITLGDGTDTASLAVTYNPQAGYAVQEVTGVSNVSGSFSENFVGAVPNTSQVLYPTANNTAIAADGTLTTDSTVDIDMWYWDATLGTLQPFTVIITTPIGTATLSDKGNIGLNIGISL